MNPTELEILEAVRGALEGVRGLRLVRLLRSKERVEVPLSRYPAAILEPVTAETLAWPDVPVGRYRLLHWRVAVMDRALPGSRAFEALVDLTGAVRDALAADGLLGGLAADGPPSARDGDLEPAVGAARLGPTYLTDATPGEPTVLRIAGACGYWAETPTGEAAIDGEPLFASGPHIVTVGAAARRLKDQSFNGLSGGLTLDLGHEPRDIVQRGILSADDAPGLALLEAAIEAFVDGRTYTLTAPDGTDYPNCRLDRFEQVGLPQVGLRWHQAYRLQYRQMAR
jgi:hypothetical protein